MIESTSRPTSLPVAASARRSSPEASTGTPSRLASSGACVPLPAPGAPSNTATQRNVTGSPRLIPNSRLFSTRPSSPAITMPALTPTATSNTPLRISCASICFIVSTTTETTMSRPVPPIASPCSDGSSTPRTTGNTATVPRNSEPARVIRLTTRPRYSCVGRPGRMPGMNPPFLRSCSAVSSGLNVNAV